MPLKCILHVVGARPNFMKMAPIMREMAQYPAEFEQVLVYTGQHYDTSMSQVQQTVLIMQRFEPVVLDYQPDWVVVPGDVNSTVACALVAGKLGVKVGIDMDGREGCV